MKSPTSRHLFWQFKNCTFSQTTGTQECSHLASNIINSLGPRRDRRHFPNDIFICVFLNENVWISIRISLKFVPRGPIDNIPALVQIMAWRRIGDKPLFEPMMVSLLTHICVTRPQWVKIIAHCRRDQALDYQSVMSNMLGCCVETIRQLSFR